MNPLDEEMRTCFICAINNEAILKSVFREKEDKLTFTKAVEIETEVEEAAKTAKAQVYSKPDEGPDDPYEEAPAKQPPPPPTKPSASTTARCYRCGENDHAMKDCRLSNAVCKFCGKKGHIEAACITKQMSSKVNLITTSTINSFNTIFVAVCGEGGGVHRGPRATTYSTPSTNYHRLGWRSTDRPLP